MFIASIASRNSHPFSILAFLGILMACVGVELVEKVEKTLLSLGQLQIVDLEKRFIVDDHVGDLSCLCKTIDQVVELILPSQWGGFMRAAGG